MRRAGKVASTTWPVQPLEPATQGAKKRLEQALALNIDEKELEAISKRSEIIAWHGAEATKASGIQHDIADHPLWEMSEEECWGLDASLGLPPAVGQTGTKVAGRPGIEAGEDIFGELRSAPPWRNRIYSEGMIGPTLPLLGLSQLVKMISMEEPTSGLDLLWHAREIMVQDEVNNPELMEWLRGAGRAMGNQMPAEETARETWRSAQHEPATDLCTRKGQLELAARCWIWPLLEGDGRFDPLEALIKLGKAETTDADIFIPPPKAPAEAWETSLEAFRYEARKLLYELGCHVGPRGRRNDISTLHRLRTWKPARRKLEELIAEVEQALHEGGERWGSSDLKLAGEPARLIWSTRENDAIIVGARVGEGPDGEPSPWLWLSVTTILITEDGGRR